MVEINNQRKAFLDMLAWSEGTDNGTSENQKSWLWRHCRRRAIYWLLRSPSQTCHAKPKTQINRRRTLPASSCWWDAYRKQLGLKDSLRKVRTLWHCSRLRSVALYLWLIVVISVRQSTVAAISGLHCRALVMVSSSIRLTAWLQIQRSGRNGQRDWCMSRVTAIISALVIRIIVRLSWAVNHYRDNAITYKAQRDKNARELEGRTRHDYADASAWCCCVRCKIHEGVIDGSRKNDALRDDVAAGRRRLHISSLSVSAWSHHRLRRG